MSFLDLLQTDAAVFFNAEEFAESVVYTPSGQSPVMLNAVVNRNPERDMTASGAPFLLVFEVWIANHPTLGLQAITERLDKVALKVRVGDAATRDFRVWQVLTQDPGAWQLEVHG